MTLPVPMAAVVTCAFAVATGNYLPEPTFWTLGGAGAWMLAVNRYYWHTRKRAQVQEVIERLER